MISTAFDPETFREQGRALVDRLADYLHRALRGEIPVLPWRPPAEMAAAWATSFPEGPASDPRAPGELFARVIAEANHLHHPRYIGHQVTAPLPVAALADLVAALLNNGMAVYEMGPSATAIERTVVRFLADRVGFGPGADGVLTSGGSIGNLTALLAARQAKAGYDAWTEGSAGGPPLAVLGSAQAHYCVARAAQIMGWGKAGFVPVPVDDRFRLRPEALDAAFTRAVDAGRRPIIVAASACSTATGSFDPLPEIAAFCEERGLWLHVDGAHGAAAALSAKTRHLVAGIERADSVVWDAHKMMLVPGLVTAVLFRDGARSYEAFAQEASYLFEGRDPEDEWFNVGTRTLECTKRMLGLKLYTALAIHGTQLFGDYVADTFDRARRFAERLAREPDFELLIPPQCNIVCFRHRPEGATDLDELQSTLRRRLIEDGSFYLVQTRLPAGVFLRITIINPATSDADLDALIYRLREAAQSR
ncbi:MAG: pyridoxal phosphate-dependent decarboxylase family protein [Byssovorax sp.]